MHHTRVRDWDYSVSILITFCISTISIDLAISLLLAVSTHLAKCISAAGHFSNLFQIHNIVTSKLNEIIDIVVVLHYCQQMEI